MRRGEAVDAFLAAKAKEFDSAQTNRLAKALLAALDPDGDGDPHASTKRSLTSATDLAGMLIGKFRLDPAAGQLLKAALDHFSQPMPTRTEHTQGGEPIEVRDDRTPAIRNADAIAEIARRALAAPDAGTRGGERPRIVVLADLHDVHDLTHQHDEHAAHEGERSQAREQQGDEHDQPSERAGRSVQQHVERHEDGGPTDVQHNDGPHQECQRNESRHQKRQRGESRRQTWRRPAAAPRTLFGEYVPFRTLRQHACDAVLSAIVQRPDSDTILYLGRDTRTITPAQRRALTARDQGCVIQPAT